MIVPGYQTRKRKAEPTNHPQSPTDPAMSFVVILESTRGGASYSADIWTPFCKIEIPCCAILESLLFLTSSQEGTCLTMSYFAT